VGFLIEIRSACANDTFELGKKIASVLKPGSILALYGVLGSGKTCLAKGVICALGIKENVTSPTYTIISEYQSSPVLYHIDAYRLKNAEDFENSGGLEAINSGGISIIEWSENIESVFDNETIKVRITITGPDSRLIQIENTGEL
jgi:tRNA threonylcarbamoyladenosine biosynthesis protein TsaE